MNLNLVELIGFQSSAITRILSFYDPDTTKILSESELKKTKEPFVIVAKLDKTNDLAFNSKNSNKSSNLIKALSQFQIQKLRQKKSVLLLDNSLEFLVFQETVFEQFYDDLKRLSIDPSYVVILTQNLVFSKHHDQYALKKGIKSKIKIFFYHAFMDWTARNWERDFQKSPKSLLKELKQYQNSSILNMDQKEYNFLLLNNMLKHHRLLTVLAVYNRGLLNKGLVSFADLNDPDKHLQSNLDTAVTYINRYFSNHASEVKNIDRFKSETPFVIDIETGKTASRKNNVTKMNFSLYKSTHFSIVTESESSYGRIIRFTEKSLKPMVAFHPFIVVGNPFTLKMLHLLGFQTFAPYIDETYDDISDANMRFNFALKEIVRIASLDQDKINQICHQLLPVLEHNFNYAVTKFPQVCQQLYQDIRSHIIDRLNMESKVETKKMKFDFESLNEKNDLQIGVIIPGDNNKFETHGISRKNKTAILTQEKKPRLAIICHLNSSGGTVISKCLGSMENIVLLSEIHPWGCCQGKGYFHPLYQYLKWHDMGELRQKLESGKHQLESTEFSHILNLISTQTSKECKQLLIREWSYIDYFSGGGYPVPYKSVLQEALSEKFTLSIVATIRHPIDMWLSMVASNFANNISLEHFLFGYWKFAQYVNGVGYFKYEDFVENPDFVLQEICQKLKTEFDPSYTEKWLNYAKITGDSGRKTARIKKRNRREIDKKLLQKFSQNPHYQMSIKLLNYE